MCQTSTSYGSNYRTLGSAKRACDEDPKCYGLQDRKCDGQLGWGGNYWKRCTNSGNKIMKVPSTQSWRGTCVHVKSKIYLISSNSILVGSAVFGGSAACGCSFLRSASCCDVVFSTSGADEVSSERFLSLFFWSLFLLVMPISCVARAGEPPVILGWMRFLCT